jgi:predicted PurR-regulated permease PerM
MSANRSALFRFNAILLAFILVFAALYLARAFLIPFTLAMLLSMLLTPLCRWFEAKGIVRGVAVALCLLLLLLTLGGIGTFLFFQLSQFTEDMPQLTEKLNEHIHNISRWLENTLNIKAKQYVEEAQEGPSGEQINSAFRIVGKVLISTVGSIFTFGIMLAYIALFLYYRTRFKRAFVRAFPTDNRENVQAIVSQSGSVAQGYLGGMFTVTTILAVLNTLGLYAVGLDYPILFGVIAGYLNFIPFVGTLIGSVLPIGYALLSSDSLWTPVVIALIFTFNQFLEETVLTPKFVGSKVSINPMIVIIAIMVGNLVWGIAGVVIFIPLCAILKIVFDNVEDLKPFGYALGQESNGDESEETLWQKVKKMFKKKPDDTSASDSTG